MQKKVRYIRYFIFLFCAPSFFFSCSTNEEKKIDYKQQYVISDSLFKTLSIDTVRKSQLMNAITLTGQVDFNQDHIVKIYPMISGIVEDANVALGDYVQKGQALGVIKSSEMAAYGNELVTAQTNLNIAQENLAKTKDLLRSGLAAVSDSIRAVTSYLQAKSELERVMRVLKINGGSTSGDYVIKAPISGFIVEKTFSNNTVIRSDNGNELYTISDLKNVLIWANVYESNIRNIHLGDQVEVTTLSYPGRKFIGKVDKIMNVLDPANRVMKVRISLDNPGYVLKPQMYASVLVRNAENKEALNIASSALIFDNSQNYVLAYKSNSDIKIIPVKFLSSDGNRTFIESPLKEGDKVIASQALLIYDGLNN
jgi:cobalt-zinc-cadmium efflux system membrane fusion protein